VLGVVAGASAVAAQPAFDPKQMSGIPRPVTDLPDRAVSVRLIRGTLASNVADHPVELHVDGRVETARTDAAGRAQFDNLTPGATVRAVAVVDGETLTSESFPAPSRGGVRLILVAAGVEGTASTPEPVSPSPGTGEVVIGGESRIVIENEEETVRVFYLLDIVNASSVPVNLPGPFLFDTPRGAISTTVLEGSSPKASANGTRVLVEGPFPPGNTLVQVGFALRASGGAVELVQAFPAALGRLVVMVEKAGDARLSSASITQQQEMPASGLTYIVGIGEALAAGQAFTLSVTGLPHHSTYPRSIALSLAGVIVAAGVWMSRRTPESAGRGTDRKRLIARREKLFQDLVSLEQEQRRGRLEASRYASRREELVAALEDVYSALGSDDRSPGPADRPGLAA
jgi:hypothetical protein